MTERFDNVVNKSLRAYNRSVMAFNIQEDFGAAKAVKYLEGFSKQEKAEMLGMMAFIQARGVEEAKKAIAKEMEVVHV